MTEELSDLVLERLAGVQQAACKYPLCQVTSCPSRPLLNVTSRGHSRLYRDLVRKLGLKYPVASNTAAYEGEPHQKGCCVAVHPESAAGTTGM